MLLFAAAPLAAQAPPAARDSTFAAVSAVAEKVAAVKSAYELYRRAAFNDTDSMMLLRASGYGTACHDLAAAARQQRPRLCRTCMERAAQSAIDQYRAYLPKLQLLGERCAVRMRSLVSRHPAAIRPAVLRHEVGPAGARMVQELRSYELRVAAVRATMAPAAGPAPPRRR